MMMMMMMMLMMMMLMMASAGPSELPVAAWQGGGVYRSPWQQTAACQ
jgi:hypothetical protein